MENKNFHTFGRWSVSLLLFFFLTSECFQRSLDVTAQQEELGCHGDQEAARRSVLVPKQTLQSGVFNFGKGQHLCHPASLSAHTHTHRQGFLTRLWLLVVPPGQDFRGCGAEHDRGDMEQQACPFTLAH